eukprot:2817029-Karenia_brevis.AAC.1
MLSLYLCVPSCVRGSISGLDPTCADLGARLEQLFGVTALDAPSRLSCRASGFGLTNLEPAGSLA